MIDKNRTKTLNNLVLKVEKLKLKRKVEQIIKTTKIKKKFIESLIESYFERFVLFSNIIDFVSVLVNASQKNKNLLDRKKVIEIFFAINIDVNNDVFNNAIDREYNCVFIDKIVIRVDE